MMCIVTNMINSLYYYHNRNESVKFDLIIEEIDELINYVYSLIIIIFIWIMYCLVTTNR